MHVMQLLSFVVLVGSALAALDLTSIVTQTPQCALTCTLQTLGNAQCPILEIRECLCSNREMQYNLAACVLQSCNITDQYKATLLRQESICNGIEQESRWPEIARATIILCCFTYTIVILRFLSRWIIAHRFWWDDWCILIATVFLIALTILPFRHANQGFGRHFWDIHPQRIVPLRKTFYATQMFYIMVQVLSKCSLLFLYLRIFTDRLFCRIVKCSIVLMIIHGLVYLFCIIFQCIPISAVWTLRPAKCLDLQPIVFSGAGITIFEDFFIMLLPVRELWKLNLSTKKKSGLAFMFAIGSFASITSIIRLRFLTKFSNSIDVTWDNVDVVIWSDIEMFSSVICACLVAVRPLLIKMTPSFLMTTDVTEPRSTPQNTSKHSQRWSLSLTKQKESHSSRRSSGHMKLSDENGEDSKTENNVRWATKKPDIESGGIQMHELSGFQMKAHPNSDLTALISTKELPKLPIESADAPEAQQSLSTDHSRHTGGD